MSAIQPCVILSTDNHCAEKKGKGHEKQIERGSDKCVINFGKILQEKKVALKEGEEIQIFYRRGILPIKMMDL